MHSAKGITGFLGSFNVDDSGGVSPCCPLCIKMHCSGCSAQAYIEVLVVGTVMVLSRQVPGCLIARKEPAMIQCSNDPMIQFRNIQEPLHGIQGKN